MVAIAIPAGILKNLAFMASRTAIMRCFSIWPPLRTASCSDFVIDLHAHPWRCAL